MSPAAQRPRTPGSNPGFNSWPGHPDSSPIVGEATPLAVGVLIRTRHGRSPLQAVHRSDLRQRHLWHLSRSGLAVPPRVQDVRRDVLHFRSLSSGMRDALRSLASSWAREISTAMPPSDCSYQFGTPRRPSVGSRSCLVEPGKEAVEMGFIKAAERSKGQREAPPQTGLDVARSCNHGAENVHAMELGSWPAR